MVLKEKKKTKETKRDDSPKKDAPKAKDPTTTGKGTKKKDEIQELRDQVAAEKDRALRLSAEFENYKKRTQREINDFKKFANESIFRQLLSVVDNLERAISAAQENSEDSALFEGVKLTHKDIIKLFETFNVKLVKAENEPFDPNFHQAVTQEENDEFPDNTVTTVLQKGYLLQDRLIRPAMVVVSKKAKKETEKNIENIEKNIEN